MNSNVAKKSIGHPISVDPLVRKIKLQMEE
jgi:hypothetical protein